MALLDFTLSNARRFYSSMVNPLGWKGLKVSTKHINLPWLEAEEWKCLSQHYSSKAIPFCTLQLTNIKPRKGSQDSPSFVLHQFAPTGLVQVSPGNVGCFWSHPLSTFLRHLKLAAIRQESITCADPCKICFENAADTRLEPCKHR